MGMSNRDYDIDEFAAKEQSDGSYLNVYGETTWYNELGQLHREDGTAIIYPDGSVSWSLSRTRSLFRTYYTFADWLIELDVSDEEKMILRLRYD